MIEKDARNKLKNPALEEIVEEKDVVNARMSRLIKLIIEVKKGLNGKPAPVIGIDTKTNIAGPLPPQVVSSSGIALQEFGEIDDQIKEIDNKQDTNANSREERLKAREEELKNIQIEAGERNESIVKFASNIFSRIWSHIKSPFSWGKQRLRLLRALGTIDRSLEQLNSNVLSGGDDIPEAIYLARQIYSDGKSSFFEEFQKSLEESIETAKVEQNKLEKAVSKNEVSSKPESTDDKVDETKPSTKTSPWVSSTAPKTNVPAEKPAEKPDEDTVVLAPPVKRKAPPVQLPKIPVPPLAKPELIVTHETSVPEVVNEPVITHEESSVVPSSIPTIEPEVVSDLAQEIEQVLVDAPTEVIPTPEPISIEPPAITIKNDKPNVPSSGRKPRTNRKLLAPMNPIAVPPTTQREEVEQVNEEKLEEKLVEESNISKKDPRKEFIDYMKEKVNSIYKEFDFNKDIIEKRKNIIDPWKSELVTRYKEVRKLVKDLYKHEGKSEDELFNLFQEFAVKAGKFIAICNSLDSGSFNKKDISKAGIDFARVPVGQVLKLKNSIQKSSSLSLALYKTAAAPQFINRLLTNLSFKKDKNIRLRVDREIKKAQQGLQQMMDNLENKNINFQDLIRNSGEFYSSLIEIYDKLADLGDNYNAALKTEKTKKKSGKHIISQVDINFLRTVRNRFEQDMSAIKSLEQLEGKIIEISKNIIDLQPKGTNAE
jgi:hypothetical protein